MTMKYSEKFFRFPVRLYLTKDIEKKKDLEERLGIELEDEEVADPEYVLGWDCIDLNDIRGFGTIFSRGKDLETVREEGFDSTVIYLTYGREVGCAWTPKKFEEKLNDFVDKMEEERKREEAERMKETAAVIKVELEKQLTSIEPGENLSLWQKILSKVKRKK